MLDSMTTADNGTFPRDQLCISLGGATVAVRSAPPLLKAIVPYFAGFSERVSGTDVSAELDVRVDPDFLKWLMRHTTSRTADNETGCTFVGRLRSGSEYMIETSSEADEWGRCAFI